MKPIRVLFVDDEPGMRLTMPEVLRQHGFSVTAVGNVNEALDEITSAQFDVLISDWNFDHPADERGRQGRGWGRMVLRRRSAAQRLQCFAQTFVKSRALNTPHTLTVGRASSHHPHKHGQEILKVGWPQHRLDARLTLL